jgi:hypothetical protein
VRRKRRRKRAKVAKSFINGKFVRAVDLGAKQKHKIRTVNQYAQSKGALGNRSDPVLSGYRKKIETEAGPLREAFKTGDQAKLAEFGEKAGFDAFAHRMGGKGGGKSMVHITPKNEYKEKFVSQSMGEKSHGHLGRHEAAHASTKRSEYRLHGQIPASMKKHGREEGRADFIASGHYRGAGHKPTELGEAPSGYSNAVQQWEKPGFKKKTIPEARKAHVEAGASSKEFDRTIKGQNNWNKGYRQVHEKMQAAKTARTVKPQVAPRPVAEPAPTPARPAYIPGPGPQTAPKPGRFKRIFSRKDRVGKAYTVRKADMEFPMKGEIAKMLPTMAERKLMVADNKLRRAADKVTQKAHFKAQKTAQKTALGTTRQMTRDFKAANPGRKTTAQLQEHHDAVKAVRDQHWAQKQSGIIAHNKRPGKMRSQWAGDPNLPGTRTTMFGG